MVFKSSYPAGYNHRTVLNGCDEKQIQFFFFFLLLLFVSKQQKGVRRWRMRGQRWSAGGLGTIQLIQVTGSDRANEDEEDEEVWVHGELQGVCTALSCLEGEGRYRNCLPVHFTPAPLQV